MRAMVYRGDGPALRLEERPVPEPGAGEEERVGEGRHGARPAEIARHLLEAHHQQEHSAVGGHHQVGGDDEHRDGEGSPPRSRVGCA